MPRRDLVLLTRKARAVHQAFGWKGGARRAVYVAGVRAGHLRRATPALPGYEALRPHHWGHTFDLDAVRSAYEAAGLQRVTSAVVTEAEQLLGGRLRFYGGDAREVGWPPRWHSFPDGTTGPSADVHWSEVSDDLPKDVKDLWEPSRFGFTFLLARAYLLTGDERWAEAWWQALEDWMRQNRPNRGVNWRCGQEASLRGIAVCFGLSTFRTAACSTNDRRVLADRLLTATVQRVRPTLGYALSQRNNHAVSEMAFLLSVANRPDRTLERLLCEVVGDQFAPDGSYSQLSLNYERLAIHALLWLLHAQPLLQIRTRATLMKTLSAAGGFLARCADPVWDRLPNAGANDGALLIDLDATDRWDAGPTLEMLGAASSHRSEAACWLPSSVIGLVPSSARRTTTSFPTLRGQRSLLFTHTGPARHRPGDDDQQSVEVIIDGAPVVLDAGSFRYSGIGVWRQPFTGAEMHNGPRPAEAIEAISIGRFLREAPPAATLLGWSDEGAVGQIVSRRTVGPVTATRSVVRQGDSYAVIDHVVGGDAVTSWLLPPHAAQEGNRFNTGSATVELSGMSAVRVARRSADDPASGWWSPRYGELVEAVLVESLLSAGSTGVVRITPAGASTVDPSAILDAMDHPPDPAASFGNAALEEVSP